MTDRGEISSWSDLLDFIALYRDTGRAMRRVERLSRRGASPELRAATVRLARLHRAQVVGYRRTRKARGILDGPGT